MLNENEKNYTYNNIDKESREVTFDNKKEQMLIKFFGDGRIEIYKDSETYCLARLAGTETLEKLMSEKKETLEKLMGEKNQSNNKLEQSDKILGYFYQETEEGFEKFVEECIDKQGIPLKDKGEEGFVLVHGDFTKFTNDFKTHTLGKPEVLSFESINEGIANIEKQEETLNGIKKTLGEDNSPTMQAFEGFLTKRNELVFDTNSGFYYVYVNSSYDTASKVFEYDNEYFALLNQVDDNKFLTNWGEHVKKLLPPEKSEEQENSQDTPSELTEFIRYLPNILPGVFLKAVELRAKGKIKESEEIIDDIAKLILKFKYNEYGELSESCNKVVQTKASLDASLKDCFEEATLQLLNKINEDEDIKGILEDNGKNINKITSNFKKRKNERKEKGIEPIKKEKVSDFSKKTLFSLNVMNRKNKGRKTNGLSLYSVVHYNDTSDLEGNLFLSNCFNGIDSAIIKKTKGNNEDKEKITNEKAIEYIKNCLTEGTFSDDNFIYDKEIQILQGILEDENFLSKEKIEKEYDYSKFIEAVKEAMNKKLQEIIKNTRDKYQYLIENDKSEKATLAYEALVCQDLSQKLFGQDFNFIQVHNLAQQESIDLVEYYLAPQDNNKKM